MKNMCDSWEEVRISALKGIWKKLILTLRDDFEEFMTSVEEVNCRCGHSKRTRTKSGA